METVGSGLSVEAVGEMSPFWPAAGSPFTGGDEEDASAVLVCRDEPGDALAPVAAAVLGTATPLTSKLQRTPAWMHREHEGLRRSQRRLKCRQRSQVFTSRIWGMLLLCAVEEGEWHRVQQGKDQCLALECRFGVNTETRNQKKKEGLCLPETEDPEDVRYAVSKLLGRRIAGDGFCVRPMLW